MDGNCEHSNVCGRDALDGHDGKCILHSENPEKDEEAFEQAFKEHREEYGPDFRRVVFPIEVDFSATVFEEEANFAGATFKMEADFSDATFEDAAHFEAITSLLLSSDTGGGESGSEVDREIQKSTTFEDTSNFQRASFGSEANFEHAIFKGEAQFESSTFGAGASFKDVTFNKKAVFDSTHFDDVADFQTSTFESDAEASFEKATFSERSYFGNCEFKDMAKFNGSSFESGANFDLTTFNGKTKFKKTCFRGVSGVSFVDSTFREEVYFGGVVSESSNFQDAVFNKEASFRLAFQPTSDFRLTYAGFRGCEFEGEAIFSGESVNSRAFSGGEVSFERVELGSGSTLRFRHVDLSQCRFLRTNLRDIEFTDIRWCQNFSVTSWATLDWLSGKEWFSRDGLYDEVVANSKQKSLRRRTIERIRSPDKPHWTLFELEGDSEDEEPGRWREVERLYRQLKLNREERGDFPRGGDFHIGEKVARHKRAWENLPSYWGRWVLLNLYRAFSKYGERALPAAFCLLALVFGCAELYDVLGASLADPRAARDLGLNPGDPLSFGGALRTSLEASFYPLRAAGFKELGPYLLNVAQRIISPVLIALFALALRQRVKR